MLALNLAVFILLLCVCVRGSKNVKFPSRFPLICFSIPSLTPSLSIYLSFIFSLSIFPSSLMNSLWLLMNVNIEHLVFLQTNLDTSLFRIAERKLLINTLRMPSKIWQWKGVTQSVLHLHLWILTWFLIFC